jgi:hypothetical protein
MKITKLMSNGKNTPGVPGIFFPVIPVRGRVRTFKKNVYGKAYKSGDLNFCPDKRTGYSGRTG